jgi:ABC-type transport system involved in multi-copper enzyme maturation permease subunit
MRLGPGPVFVYEGLTAARRWQLYAMRAGFVGLILIGMASIWSRELPQAARGAAVSFRDLARFGEQMYLTIAQIELTLVLLVAPAATAGAVCLDKARGTLDHMLVTDLSNAEIVLGKLGVRLIPVLGLIACTLPVLALASLLGGIEPMALVGLFVVAIGCAVVGCSLAMVLSIYGRKTHEVLMMTYLILIIWLIAPGLLAVVEFLLSWGPPAVWRTPLDDWVERSNPYILAFWPYRRPAKLGVGTYLGFLAGCLAVAGALTGLATARIRRVIVSQVGRPAAGRRRSRLVHSFLARRLPGPSLDGNPVAWREWHRARPSLMMRIVWGLYSALALLSICAAAAWSPGGPAGEGIAFMGMLQVSVGLLLVSVAAATSLAEERVRGSLDVLLSTPMSTRSILAGKWWGSFRTVLNVAIWPAAMVFVPAVKTGNWGPYLALLGLVPAYGAAITSLGLALATWVSRVGRAVASCVAVYVVFVIGWPILIFVVLSNARGSDFAGFLLLLGDPPFGAGFMSVAAYESGVRIAGGATFDDLVVGAVLWIAAYIGIALFLNWITLSTFDGCLGRIPDVGLRPPPRPRRRSSLSEAELLALVPSSSEDEEEP